MAGLSGVVTITNASRRPPSQRRKGVAHGRPDAPGRPVEWAGRSGETFIHMAYALVACPEVPRANYILVERAGDGRPYVLAVGRVENAAPSLNLAHIRRRGATLGANEVHVYVHPGNVRGRRRIEQDLKAAVSAARRRGRA